MTSHSTMILFSFPEMPHSCNSICGKSRTVGCPHPCSEICHPGPCPECPIMSMRSCNCGAETKALRCGILSEFKVSLFFTIFSAFIYLKAVH